MGHEIEEGPLARLGDAVDRRRGAALAAVLAMAALGVAGATRLQVDNSNEGTFAPDAAVVADYKELKRAFGNDEFAVVALEPPSGDAFDPTALEVVGRLEAAIRALPHVRRVTSIRSVRHVVASATTVEVRPFIPTLPPAADAARVARAHPRYADTYVDPAGRVLALVVDTEVPDEDAEGKPILAGRLRELLAAPDVAALRPRLAGAPIFEADFDVRTAREGGLLFGLSVLVSGAFLAAAFRRARPALVPLAVAVVATLVTLGAMGVTGQPVSLYGIILPALLVTVGVADAVHLVDGVLESGSARRAYAEHARACVFTSLTTAAGFLPFATSDVQSIRVLGLFAPVGVLACLAAALLLAPWAVARRDPAPAPEADPEPTGAGAASGSAHDAPTSNLDPLAKLAAWSVEHAGLVLAITAVVCGLALAAATRVRVDTYWLDAFRPSSPLRQEFAFVDERLGGAFALEVLVDGGAEGALDDPELLARLARFEARVRADPSGLVGPVLGPPDLVGEVHAALVAEGQAAAVTSFVLPATREAVAQELMVLDADDVAELIDSTHRRGRVHVRVRSAPSSAYLELLGRIEAAARDEGLSVRTTGVMKVFSELPRVLTHDQREQFVLAAAAIGALLALSLRSLRLGLLALVPNLIPLLLTLGLMGALGLDLDLVTCLVACIALGISDDDTVHFLLGYRRARAAGLAPPDAARSTAAALARPTAIMSGALVAGFLVFLASSTAHLPRFGLVAATAIAAAWLCELVVTPALLARFDRA